MPNSNSDLPIVSLIIAVYNKPEFLRYIFTSLRNQTFRNFEVIVADDGSGPEIGNVINEFTDSFMHPIKHIRHDHQGFRKTIIANKAVHTAQSEYLVFIDGDCLLHHRFLERHYIRRQPGVVLSGRRVSFDQELTLQLTDQDVSERRNEQIAFWTGHCPKREIKHGFYLPLTTVIDKWFRKTWPILGCNFSLYKSDYLSVNGYDERIIGRGMEDSNLYERLRVKRMQFRNMSREALQYHLFHTYDPIPHSPEVIKEFCFPTHYWTPFGITKGPEPLSQAPGAA